jgi:hypothetical protein
MKEAIELGTMAGAVDHLGRVLPRAFWWRRELDGQQLRIRLEYNGDRYVSTETHIIGSVDHPDTRENHALLSKNLDKIAATALDQLVATPLDYSGAGLTQRPIDREAARQAIAERQTRRYIDAELLTEVADIYKNGGRRPTASVVEHFNVSTAQASRYVKAARQAGLLPEVSRGVDQ